MSSLQVLARATQRERVVNLYRRILKTVPHTIRVYDLDLSEKQVKQGVRNMFERNRALRDKGMIDVLLTKAELDFTETVEIWKQKTHLLRILGYDESSTVKIALRS